MGLRWGSVIDAVASAHEVDSMPHKSPERAKICLGRRMVDLACVDCGRIDRVLPGPYKNGLLRRCRPCALKDIHARCKAGISGKVDVECSVCKAAMKCFRSDRAYLAKTMTCSEECRRARRRRGPDHPQWKGNTHAVYYGADWRKQSAAARVRDGNMCRECGILRAQYGREFDVHHIVRFLSFASSAEANVLTNLITLCRTCHRRADVAQHAELKAAGIELNGQRKSRRRTYPLFERMANVVCLFARNWGESYNVKSNQMIEGECVGGLVASIYAINYNGSLRRSRGLRDVPDRGQITSYRRFTSEVEADCWRFTLEGEAAADPRPPSAGTIAR